MAPPVIHVCLFSLLATITALPVSHKLLPPYLNLGGRGSTTQPTRKAIPEALREAGCKYDNVLNIFYTTKDISYLPQLRTPSRVFADLYNGNIELLWLISNSMWLKDMCQRGTLKDLSSLPFCTNLISEEKLEDTFIASMNETLSALQLLNIIKFASDLHKLRGKEECREICGDNLNSVLCAAFTEMSAFIVYQVVSSEVKSVQDAESTLPLVGSAESDGVGPSNTKVQPGISNKPLSPDSSLPPGKPSEGTSGNPNGPANGVSIAPPEQRVNQPPVPPLDAKNGGPNGPTTSTTPTVSSEALQAAIDKYLKDNYDPKVLEMLSRVTNAPSTHSGAAIDNNEGEGSDINNDAAKVAATSAEENPTINSAARGGGGETEKPDLQTPNSDLVVEPEGNIFSEPSDKQVYEWMQEDDDDDDGDGDVSLLQNKKESNQDPKGQGALIPDVTPDEDDYNDPFLNYNGATVAINNEDGDTGEQQNKPPPSVNKNNNAKPDTKPDNAGKQPKVNTANKAVGADSQAEYEDDFEEDSGGGYRSIHFFSIILVLVIFTVVAYFCVHHKKKIKETMKDYVSDGQKRRRTRGAYKPLLSGKS